MTDAPELRASDAERQHVVETLRRHLGEGRLTLGEFADRASLAYEARTVGELEPLLHDLPDLPPAPARPDRTTGAGVATPRLQASSGKSLADRAWRFHLYLWLVLSLFWILIWAGTGTTGTFWPIFPIAGFGVSVGIHAAIRKA